MPRFDILALAATLPFLGACDLITDTEYVQVNGDPIEEKPPLSEIAASSLYDPVLHGSVSFEEMLATGVPGFVGNPDGSISEVWVRVDAGVLYVSRDGGPEVAYSNSNYITSNPISFYGDWAGENGNLYYSVSAGRPGSFSDYSSDRSVGYLGMETDPSALPTGSAIYSGNFNASNEGSYLYGNLGLDVDFASGEIGGTATGTYYFTFEETPVSGAFLGDIAGSVTGSRVGGTMFADGADMSGEFDFMGGIYGESGQYINGGVGGTLTTTAGETSVGGVFSASSGDGFDD